MAIQTPDNMPQWQLREPFALAHGTGYEWMRPTYQFQKQAEPIGGAVHFHNGQLRDNGNFLENSRSLGSALNDGLTVLFAYMQDRDAGARISDMVYGPPKDTFVDPVERMADDVAPPEQPLKFTPFGPSGSGGG